MLRPLALALLLPLAALADDGPAKKLKTDSPIRQKRVKEFLSGDAEKKTLAMAESAKWLTVPAAAAAKELDLLRRHVPVRGL